MNAASPEGRDSYHFEHLFMIFLEQMFKVN